MKFLWQQFLAMINSDSCAGYSLTFQLKLRLLTTLPTLWEGVASGRISRVKKNIEHFEKCPILFMNKSKDGIRRSALSLLWLKSTSRRPAEKYFTFYFPLLIHADFFPSHKVVEWVRNLCLSWNVSLWITCGVVLSCLDFHIHFICLMGKKMHAYFSKKISLIYALEVPLS